MVTKRKLSTNTNDEYEKFLAELEFIAIRLLNSSCKFDSAADTKLRAQNKTPSVTMSLTSEYKLGRFTEQFFESLGKLRLEMQVQKMKLKPVVVECSFEGHFHVKSSFSKKSAERFTDQDFRLVLWPYFRQFVQDMTGRMGIRPIVIPLGVQD